MNSKVKKQLDYIVKRYRADGYKHVGKWKDYEIYSLLADRRITIGFIILGVKNDIVKEFHNKEAEKVSEELVEE